MADDSERIRRRLPDYFKVIAEPWHLAVGLLAEFVTDDEEAVTESGHVRNLFHVAKALDEENATLRASLAEAMERVEGLEKALAPFAKARDLHPPSKYITLADLSEAKEALSRPSPQATPKCHCAEYYPGQGHPPDCPTQKPQATPETCQDCNREKCACVGECPCGGPADHPGDCLGSKPQATPKPCAPCQVIGKPCAAHATESTAKGYDGQLNTKPQATAGNGCFKCEAVGREMRDGVCLQCWNDGSKATTGKECEYCEGHGEVEISPDGDDVAGCEKCGGSGKKPEPREKGGLAP